MVPLGAGVRFLNGTVRSFPNAYFVQNVEHGVVWCACVKRQIVLMRSLRRNTHRTAPHRMQRPHREATLGVLISRRRETVQGVDFQNAPRSHRKLPESYCTTVNVIAPSRTFRSVFCSVCYQTCHQYTPVVTPPVPCVLVSSISPESAR